MSQALTTYPTESYTEPVTGTWYVEHSDPVPTSQLRHCFVWPEKVWTANEAISKGNWRSRAVRIAQWRDAYELMARGCQPLEWCNVTVDHLLSTRRKADAGAAWPSYKAALDGITRAGVLEDDGPQWVRAVTFHAPVYAGRDALIVSLVGPVAERGK